MKELEPRTKEEKTTRIIVGLVLAAGVLLGGIIGVLCLVFGLCISGNALFAPTK